MQDGGEGVGVCEEYLDKFVEGVEGRRSGGLLDWDYIRVPGFVGGAGCVSV